MESFFLCIIFALIVFQDSITKIFTSLDFLTNLDEVLILISFVYALTRIFKNKPFN